MAGDGSLGRRHNTKRAASTTGRRARKLRRHGVGDSSCQGGSPGEEAHDWQHLEDTGRDAWKEDGNQSLGKFNHSLANWGFYPKCLGTLQEIKKYGQAGTHYAAGYVQSGEMVLRQGRDYSTWPRLVMSKHDDEDDEKPTAASAVSTAPLDSNPSKESHKETETLPQASRQNARTDDKSNDENKHEADNNNHSTKHNDPIVTPTKTQENDNGYCEALTLIEIKRQELAFKMDLYRSYRELKRDFAMSDQQMAKCFPEMKQFFDENEKEEAETPPVFV